MITKIRKSKMKRMEVSENRTMWLFYLIRRTSVAIIMMGLVAIFLYNLSFVESVQAAPGDLDTSFDTDGLVLTDFSGTGSSDLAFALTIQSDGKILVAGYSTANGDNDFALARYEDSPVIGVDIDIKPGSEPNSINCLKDRTISVGILTTNISDGDSVDFDATTVDHTTEEFDGASEIHSNKKGVKRHEEDVDGDGDTDLLLHFKLSDTNLDCTSTEGTLTGQTFGGQAIEGVDSVNMID